MNELVKTKAWRIKLCKNNRGVCKFLPISRPFNSRTRWEDLASIMASIAQKLEMAGAHCIVIATNTMHKVADEFRVRSPLPSYTSRMPLAEEIKNKKMKKGSRSWGPK